MQRSRHFQVGYVLTVVESVISWVSKLHGEYEKAGFTRPEIHLIITLIALNRDFIASNRVFAIPAQKLR